MIVAAIKRSAEDRDRSSKKYLPFSTLIISVRKKLDRSLENVVVGLIRDIIGRNRANCDKSMKLGKNKGVYILSCYAYQIVYLHQVSCFYHNLHDFSTYQPHYCGHRL